MSESSMRQRVVRALNDAGLHAVSIENSVGIGTPDVSWAYGFLELKWLRSGPVRLPHYTAAQRHWLKSRCKAGGVAHLLLCVAGEFFLIWGSVAATASDDELCLLAIEHGPLPLIIEKLKEYR